MFKEQYTKLNQQVSPHPHLVQETIEQASAYAERSHGKHRAFYKPVIALASIFLCISVAIPAAAQVEPIYQLMYMVSPTIAQFFMPVQKSDEDQGIKMEVVSAYVHENIAEIYITMQDLTGDRIDATTDLYDSYSINRAFDSSSHCERIGFDEATKTATFLITIEEWGKHKIVGDKITFSANQFLSHKTQHTNIPIPLDLSTVNRTPPIQSVDTRGGGGLEYDRYVDADGKARVLTPDQAIAGFSVDGIDVTAIGYVDGKLHVQMAVHNPLKTDNHGFFFLLDENDNPLPSSCSISFSNAYDTPEERIDYCEYVFDIPPEELGNFMLYGTFFTSGLSMEGDWRITFPLEAAK